LFTRDKAVVVSTTSAEKNAVQEFLSNVAGPMAHFLWAKHSSSEAVAGIAVFDDAVAVENALAVDGQAIDSHPLSVVRYDSSVVFPSFASGGADGSSTGVEPSLIAKALASTVL
jgi:hypothetical protein